jgi:hypothetical protein
LVPGGLPMTSAAAFVRLSPLLARVLCLRIEDLDSYL